MAPVDVMLVTLVIVELRGMVMVPDISVGVVRLAVEGYGDIEESK